jgi:hypothetical protein
LAILARLAGACIITVPVAALLTVAIFGALKRLAG